MMIAGVVDDIEQSMGGSATDKFQPSEALSRIGKDENS